MVLGLILIRFDFFYRKIKRQRSAFYKCATWSLLVVIIILIAIWRFIVSSNHPMAITKTYIYFEPFKAYFSRANHSTALRDWNDHDMYRRERKRSGLGEHGVDTYIDGQDPKLEETLIAENGHNVLVSDMISLDRAIPDFRNNECKLKEYSEDLPKVSIIIPFYDENMSTLLRTLHSIINRTPKELLREIILVNDDSRKHYDQLNYHIAAKQWSNLVKLVEMDEQSGEIWCRLAGARVARGDVLLFLDCHVEVGYNYLPPLLEPIARNYKTVTVPTLDVISKKTYEISEFPRGRTVFDWHFHAQRIPLRDSDWDLAPDENYPTPVIWGSTYAISTKHFWELKPDSGLITQGADFLEMSFKINLCGGSLLEVPCSRIAHLYRRFPYEKHDHDIDFKAANNKRVAEIWLDEFKEALYSRHPERYKRIEIDEEDIEEQLQLKKSLKCLPFRHFIQEIAPDMIERYPLEEHKHFAAGAVRIKALNNTCLEISGDKDYGESARLEFAPCARNVLHPHEYQYFILRHYRDIQIRGRSDCLENANYGMFFTYGHCHYNQANQYFRYNPETLQIHWGPKRNDMCLDVDLEEQIIVANKCDEKRDLQQFVWATMYLSSLQNWTGFGAAIMDEKELLDLTRKKN